MSMLQSTEANKKYTLITGKMVKIISISSIIISMIVEMIPMKIDRLIINNFPLVPKLFVPICGTL